jgi:hypothetical protein
MGALAGLAWLAGCASEVERLSGDYHSTWGLCVVQVHGRVAVVNYPRGAMNCRVEEPATLRCTWESGKGRGKALLRVQPDQTIRGTWGRNDSDSDGGLWVMAR